jgi:hypothetical protein
MFAHKFSIMLIIIPVLCWKFPIACSIFHGNVVGVGYKAVFRRLVVITLKYFKLKHVNITVFT